MRPSVIGGRFLQQVRYLLPPMALLAMAFVPASGAAAQPALALHATSATNGSPFCSKLGKSIQASSGAQMWCFGPQPTGPGAPVGSTLTTVSANVDAANPHEDVTASGVQAYGQSEESIAAVGPYVVEAWNDATGFFAPCPSPAHKEELTGYGFSANGGASFTDEGGLPNTNCSTLRLFGDPSVEAWHPGGSAYFYVSSLYDNPAFVGQSYLAINACKASGTGSSASINCGQPIIVAASTQCVTQNGATFCSFLDKEFLALDPQRGRLYVSYTEFGFSGNLSQGQIELAVCDIGTASGATGPAGGTAAHPVCEPGTTRAPYMVLAPGPTCENEGAYPAVDIANGDVYVAYENNWATNFMVPACTSLPTRNVVDRIPFSCLSLTPASPCAGPSNTASVKITSMDAAFIPGYNRFPMNDFPRIGVSDPAGTVSIVWNDARLHPVGDILLTSFNLGNLSTVQSAPVRINAHTGGWHMLPALRQADDQGQLNISYYERGSANTALTNVDATLNVSPRATSTPTTETLVTTVATNWDNVSSDIVPNFGDYTDNYMLRTASAPYVNNNLFVAWADGRLGLPQPFEAHMPA